MHTRPISDEQKQREQWKLNYKEAAVYLEEGRVGEDFSLHPQCQHFLRHYLFVHHPIFQIIYLIVCIILLALGIFEWPTVPTYLLLSFNITCPIELLCLAFFMFELVMRIKWTGMVKASRDKGTVIKLLFTLILIVDALWVLAAQQNHPRFTRCLRPIYLIDSMYMRGTKLFLVHVFKSVAPAVDVLILICFTILTYAVIAFNSFGGGVNGDIWFVSLNQSFISMFILLTTANYPDVMMAVYNYNRWNAALFISYLSITLYFLMNLVYAVVYDKFSSLEKDRTKRLFLQRRNGCRLAFKLLVTKASPRQLSLQHFAGMMEFFAHRRQRTEVYLIFKLLNKSRSGKLSLSEFYGVYDACLLQWTTRANAKPEFWFENFTWMPGFLQIMFRTLCAFVHSWTFRLFIYAAIVANFIQVLVLTVYISNQMVAAQNTNLDFSISWYTIMFTSIFVFEIFLKLLAVGPKYFFKLWNIFDFILAVLTLIAICVPSLQTGAVSFVLIIRPIRFAQLLRYHRRYRYILSTAFLIMRRCLQLAFAIICIYYFFAIIGMELFGAYDLTNCCVGTMVQANFQGPEFNASRGYYMLDNFSGLFMSGVTLFHLTVVNNWFIPMEGYAYGATPWARIFFMFYFFVTVVLFSTVFAYIVEAFIYHVQVAMTTNDLPKNHVRLREKVYLNVDEMNLLRSSQQLSGQLIALQAAEEIRRAGPTQKESTSTSSGEKLSVSAAQVGRAPIRDQQVANNGVNPDSVSITLQPAPRPSGMASRKSSYATQASADFRLGGDAMRRISRVALPTYVRNKTSGETSNSAAESYVERKRVSRTRKDKLFEQARKLSVGHVQNAAGIENPAFEGRPSTSGLGNGASVEANEKQKLSTMSEAQDTLFGQRIFVFIGKRTKNKYDFSLMFNESEIPSWIEQERYHPRRLVEYSNEEEVSIHDF